MSLDKKQNDVCFERIFGFLVVDIKWMKDEKPDPSRKLGECAAEVFVKNGSIAMYLSKTRCKFIAYCGLHGRACQKEHTLLTGKNPAQGRPLGHLLAWLDNHAGYTTAAAHKLRTHYKFDWEDRLRLREAFNVEFADDFDANHLLISERDHDPESEPIEPKGALW